MITSFTHQKKCRLCKMLKKQLYKCLIIAIIITGVISILTLFVIYTSEINQSLNNVEGAWIVLFIILFRIAILSGMTFYVFQKWFKQEAQYLSDLPSLFGFFFLFLIFGKFLDLLFDLTYFTLEDDGVLFILKIRFFIAVLTLFPMIFLSLGMLLYYLSLKNKYKKLNNEKYRNKVRSIIIVIITLIEIIAIILAPNTVIVGILLPCFVLPSLLTITWLFAFAHKNKALPQVNPLVLTLTFIAYLISQILRPLFQNIFDPALYIIISEIIDLVIFAFIFLGFYLKPHYKID